MADIGKIKDLTGQKFGELIVIAQTNKRIRGQVVWKCECSCGKIVYLPSYSITSGETKTCGADFHKRKNIIGKQFGELTVLSFDKKVYSKGGNPRLYYVCRCSCGIEKSIDGASLRNGHTISCGHINKIQDSDYIGKKFGRLTPLKRVEIMRSEKRACFECVCECGNHCVVDAPHLLSGHTKSCGCYLSDKNRIIHKRYNNIVEEKDIAKIYDSNGNITIIDADDVNKVSSICWFKCENGYFYGHDGDIDIPLHRYILDLMPGDGKVVDHINGNSLDNRRSNLRICTTKENVWNGKLYDKNKYGIPGVYRSGRKFYIKSTSSGIAIHEGPFDSIEEAAIARYKYEQENRNGFSRGDWYKNFEEVLKNVST